MKEKVVFDTNIIRNTEINTFFGGRNELMRFAEVADIVIPETVIQEIKRQKRKSLKSNKDKFVANPFHNLLGVDENNTNAFSIDDYIEKLVTEEEFSFEIIDIKDNNVLLKIKELAFNKLPPFEGSDNTDKGFKDALIYFSVLEYLDEIPNKYIFVCVKDGRLKEALDSHHNIIVVESYDEFKQKSVAQFFDDYFIKKVNAELEIEITKDNIIEYWININDNQVVFIKTEEKEFVIEVDSGEIVDSSIVEEYRQYINFLINVQDYILVNDYVVYLEDYQQFFNEEERNRILNASFENDRFRWQLEEPSVRQFVGLLYENTDFIYEPRTLHFLQENFD
ncbi:PIN domain-containing protein [uncultured Zobellia sp.]|uniref:PIN domain-containing protein n=1 Tax=uncultured Zobellia sp. TaxID=255433 RepID=UPI002592735A|nr:PIN domain-containing protein [uncultured Zobellia sp.]